ncbi:UvrD-helicase domain-containing protein [Henriciella sp.]|uniref:UvrD-helicase domain-containing protein n=1 Tax=Henriciella sp. TaxID=1968823 RepID=UPI0032EED3A1
MFAMSSNPNRRPSISEMAAARAPVPETTPDFLEGLNPEQREAVETTEGPLLVLAGAGTGKTRVLTTRLAHIIASKLAWPSQTLTVTFTNKAAREMRERAMSLIGEAGEGLRWLGTFHSISAQILRRHAELAGLKSSFTILDSDDAIRLCKQVIEAEGIDSKRWTPRHLASVIDGWKNRALTPGKVPKEEAWNFADGKAVKLYEIYQSRLKVLNACDFGDLLIHNITIFQDNPDLLADYHQKFKYILVDEYQDTNVAQYLWLRLLARGTGNICCVGDDDQSIYGWRGAEVDNILRFEKDFPGAKVIRLERNYRSTAHILGAASSVIAQNKGRLGKTLYVGAETGADPDAERVKVRGLWDGEAEARLICDDIESYVNKGGQYEDCAILVRASWQMRLFEERLIMLGIPYRVIGGPRFFERAEIRDALAYLRLIRSPDDDLAFERVVNQPKRGVGATTVQKLQMFAREDGRSLFTLVPMVLQTDEVKGPAKRGLTTFIDQINLWRDRLNNGMPHHELAQVILDESGYTDMLQKDRSPQSQTRLDNLKELIHALGQFDSLPGFLEHVELVMDVGGQSTGNEVQILTLHAAKGLEWPMVFLPGWEEEVFPSKRSMDESGMKGLEEERRLAYVGITRAREKCSISFVANRMIFGRWQSVLPSRFVDELPHDHVEAVSETGYSTMPGAGQGFQGTIEDLGERSSYNSPGWRRLKENARSAGKSGPVIEGKAELLATSGGQSGFRIGQRVHHEKFGYGQVLAADGTKLQVNFEKAGLKKVISTFVTGV